MISQDAADERWQKILAPRTGSVRAELILELSEYLSLPPRAIEDRLHDAASRFTEEWRQRVTDPTDEATVIRFYNESQTEIFDLAQWHAEDPIHLRALMCLDLAQQRPGRRLVDYGSGIGSDALVFAQAGFDVTLADVSTPLLSFARWRCERRGHRVKVVDLKVAGLPRRSYDAAICFDVLEHVLRPARTLRQINRAMETGGLLFVHAPFGADPERPMHVVHEDVITRRMRAVGFSWRGDLERESPAWLWAPRVYERSSASTIDRAGYYVHDVWMPGRIGAACASVYRALRRVRPGHEASPKPPSV
jgi:2-polyprenyl-3-methyl-5-hydroxy-6-metoxy-1,4-benzoquinol methylase